MGKTWSDKVVLASNPKYKLCEVSILEENGVLVAFLRENSHMGYPAFKAFSYDKGEYRNWRRGKNETD